MMTTNLLCVVVSHLFCFVLFWKSVRELVFFLTFWNPVSTDNLTTVQLWLHTTVFSRIFSRDSGSWHLPFSRIKIERIRT